MNTDRAIESVIGIGIVLYVVLYFLVGVILALNANATTKTYAPLITLILVFIFLGCMWGGYEAFVKKR